MKSFAQDILQNGLKLSFQNMCTQAYNGAANMLGKNSGMGSTLICKFEKALHLHSLRHCINLATKSANLVSSRMKDCIDVCLELLKLIKYSLKRKTVLENLKLENYVESRKTLEEDADDNVTSAKLKKFSKMH